MRTATQRHQSDDQHLVKGVCRSGRGLGRFLDDEPVPGCMEQSN